MQDESRSVGKKKRRKQQAGNQPLGPPLSEILAFTILEFCAAHRISRGRYFELKRRGKAPIELDLGDGKKVITKESAEAWRRQRTLAAA